MCFRQWKWILELNKKKSKLTDDVRVDIIIDCLEHGHQKIASPVSNWTNEVKITMW